MNDKISTGYVVWITGLSGAGKSTIANALCNQMRREAPNVLLMDGDWFRDMTGQGFGHSLEERRQIGFQIARFCHGIAQQGIHVVCSTMSLFSEIHRFNREKNARYLEIFVDCPIDVLIRRDQKGIYSAAQSGRIRNVIGVDLPYDRPANADLVIDNSTADHLSEKVKLIIDRLGSWARSG